MLYYCNNMILALELRCCTIAYGYTFLYHNPLNLVSQVSLAWFYDEWSYKCLLYIHGFHVTQSWLIKLK